MRQKNQKTGAKFAPNSFKSAIAVKNCFEGNLVKAIEKEDAQTEPCIQLSSVTEIAKGSLLYGEHGYQPIETLHLGDKILMGDGIMHPICHHWYRGTKMTIMLQSAQSLETFLPLDTSIQVRERSNYSANDVFLYLLSSWKTIDELEKDSQKQYYAWTLVNQDAKVPDCLGSLIQSIKGEKMENALSDSLYQIGWFVGNGSLLTSEDDMKQKWKEIILKCERSQYPNIKGVYRIQDTALAILCSLFGVDKQSRHLPIFIPSLPIPYLRIFLDGVIASCGEIYKTDFFLIPVENRILASELALCINKAFQTGCEIREGWDGDGSKTLQKPSKFYIFGTKNSEKTVSDAFVEGNKMWNPIYRTLPHREMDVYAIETDSNCGILMQNCIIR